METFALKVEEYSAAKFQQARYYGCAEMRLAELGGAIFLKNASRCKFALQLLARRLLILPLSRERKRERETSKYSVIKSLDAAS